MRTKPDEITLADYRRLTAKHPRKAKKAPRVDIPRADDQPRDGLTALLRRGWSTREDERGAQLYQNWGKFLSTGWHRSLSDACRAAKALEGEG